jgi:hypothetical protein
VVEDAALDADEDVALDADEADEMAQAEMSSILNLAATLFEFAGRLDNATPERRTIFAPPLNDFCMQPSLVLSLITKRNRRISPGALMRDCGRLRPRPRSNKRTTW